MRLVRIEHAFDQLGLAEIEPRLRGLGRLRADLARGRLGRVPRLARISLIGCPDGVSHRLQSTNEQQRPIVLRRFFIELAVRAGQGPSSLPQPTLGRPRSSAQRVRQGAVAG